MLHSKVTHFLPDIQEEAQTLSEGFLTESKREGKIWTILRGAIENKRIVVASYLGKRRFLCPHALGTKNGKKRCLFYQFSGLSNSQPIKPRSTNNWRCMNIKGLRILEVRSGEWKSYSPHSIPQTCIDNVEYEVNWRELGHDPVEWKPKSRSFGADDGRTEAEKRFLLRRESFGERLVIGLREGLRMLRENPESLEIHEHPSRKY